MSSYWTTSDTSTSTSTWGRVSYAYRPLSHLREEEKRLKEESLGENPPMPKEPIMFDPEELVLGGETGWKKF